MEDFNYLNCTRYIFGHKKETEVGRILKENNTKKVLVVYGKHSATKNGLIDIVKNSIETNNIKCFLLGGIEPNPKDNLVYDGIKLVKENDIDYLLAVGGGSVIDTCKAISFGSFIDGDFFDYYLNWKPINKTVPIGVILTIAASGSESSTNSVITSIKYNKKLGYANELLRPKFAILDPELTFTLSEKQTFIGIADIIAHLLERYFSPSKNVYTSDLLIEGCLNSLIYESTPKLKKNLNDYDARSNVMWCGTLAHSNILGCDRKQDWATHKMSYELSATYGVIHGVAVGILFPSWMKIVYKNDVEKFYQFAIKVMHIKEGKNHDEIALEGIKKFKKFLSETLLIPATFSELNCGPIDINLLNNNIWKNNASLGGFKVLTRTDTVNILKNCI